MLGVATAPTTFEGIDGSPAMRVGEVADVKITVLAGQGGAQVTIANHPLAIVPGQELVASKADHLRFTDHGYEWELSDSNGFFSRSPTTGDPR